MVLAMTTWFSASAVLPQLRQDWSLTTNEGSLLTISVQLGFVVGAVVSTAANLADLVAPLRLMLLGRPDHRVSTPAPGQRARRRAMAVRDPRHLRPDGRRGTGGRAAGPRRALPVPGRDVRPGPTRRAFADRGVRLATIGYFGHMWHVRRPVGLFRTAPTPVVLVIGLVWGSGWWLTRPSSRRSSPSRPTSATSAPRSPDASRIAGGLG